MTEMVNYPKDKNNNNNILVDDYEEENNKNQEVISQKETNLQDIKLNIEINESNVEENNYLLKMFKKNFTINLILLLGLIVLIMIEFIYGRSLFSYSLTYEQNLQNYLSKDGIKFFNIVSNLGNGILIGIGLFFTLCYYPLIQTIILCITTIFVVYLHDIIKLLYGDPRPFWINTILFKGNCETSYGNPSGHSLINFFFCLSLSYYLCMLEKIKNNLTYKIIVYLIAIFISALIAFSRLALGVHSLDQVLYGSAIGIWVFVIFAYVFKIYDMPLSYYLRFYKERKYFNFVLITLLILFILPIILYYSIDVKSDFKKYELVMNKRCSEREQFKFYSHNCMAESLILLLIIGIYFGQYLFWYLIYRNHNNNDSNYLLSIENSVNYWNNYYKEIYASIGNLIKVLGLIIISLLPGIFYLIIDGKNSSLRNVFIFKIGLPLFLIGFLFFGPCFYGLIHILKEKKSSITNYSLEQ